MKPENYAGFTIIETMLFLGITGLLVMGVLVGAGTSINAQRYLDSVTSLQSTLQQQYSEVANVSNDNTDNKVCGANLGQSDCVVLGRYITTTDSHTIVIKSVISTKIPSTIPLDDVAAFTAYGIQALQNINSETYDMEWGSRLVDTTGKIDAVFSMLILRSPTSGVIRTFIDSSQSINPNNIASLLSANPSALTQSIKVCVSSNGLFAGGKSAVLVSSNAESASGVETQGETTSQCK